MMTLLLRRVPAFIRPKPLSNPLLNFSSITPQGRKLHQCEKLLNRSNFHWRKLHLKLIVCNFAINSSSEWGYIKADNPFRIPAISILLCRKTKWETCAGILTSCDMFQGRNKVLSKRGYRPITQGRPLGSCVAGCVVGPQHLNGSLFHRNVHTRLYTSRRRNDAFIDIFLISILTLCFLISLFW